MMTTIEWTEKTWNPTTGCDKISTGCLNCYAERMSKRLKGMGQKKYRNGFELTTHPDTLDIPYTWRKPQMVFVCSMSDLFHQGIFLNYVAQVFKVMNKCPQHTFQVLTKRAASLWVVGQLVDWTKNIWLGVTVENQEATNRIDYLRKTEAHIKFLSIEPLLEPIKLNLSGIDWVIVGGESGPGARPMKGEWVIDIRSQCKKAGVPFFFKQWGGVNKKKNGRLLEGKIYDEMPIMNK